MIQIWNLLPMSLKCIVKSLVYKFAPKSNLWLLAKKYQTDKTQYARYYEHYFSRIRKKKLNILEIGVGGHDHPERGGGSVRMWRDYFPNSMIFAFDIYEKSSHADQRIKIYRGSQNDTDFLITLAKNIGKIDIIIDDGSHISEHIITSFNTLFPFLADDGIYVIEDLGTSYIPEYGGSFEDFNDSKTAISMVKGLIDGLHFHDIQDYLPTYFNKNIVGIHLHRSIVFIFKGENTFPKESCINKYANMSDEEIIKASSAEQ